MKNWKRGLSLLLVAQCFLSDAYAQKCSFESTIAPDDQALLDNVKQALTPMSNNPACQAQVQQIRTFEQALTAYNQQANALNSGGISCMNYDNV